MSKSFTIGNAAYSMAKTVEDINSLAATRVDVITVGSITEEERTGNAEPRWFLNDNYALNSFGMPNGGAKFYLEHLPEMITIAHEAGKELSLSIAGFSTEEYSRLASLANTVSVDQLELNLGCPNISIDGKQKPIASFSQSSIREIVESVGKVTKLPLLLKLSPYSNPAELQAVANLIVDLGIVKSVVTSNTFPNGYMINDKNDVLASGYGGVSGPAMLPIALGQVCQFRQALPPEIGVIGVGGIETADDVSCFRKAGACGIQVATLLVRDGHQVIDRIVA